MITDELGLEAEIDCPLLACGCHMRHGKWEHVCEKHEPPLRAFEALARETLRKQVLRENV